MKNEIISIHFKEGQYETENESLQQWDYGKTLQIEGVSYQDGNIEIHFSLEEKNGLAAVLIGTVKDNIITVKIPQFILEGPEYVSDSYYEAFAYVYPSDEETGQTVKKVIFFIKARSKPEDYVHTEDEIKTWIRLENEIKEIKAKADFLAEYGVTTFEELEEAYQNGRSISALKINGENSIVKLEAGTYDADGNLLQTWEELNHNIEVDVSPPYGLGTKLHEDTVTLIIADGVKKIGDSQLYGSSTVTLKAQGLKYIYIPESVTDIGDAYDVYPSAFAYISTLESIAIPNSVTFINSNTFSGCTNLKTIYYSGTATGAPWGTSNATILPYEDAPQELLGLVGKETTKQLHADLHVKKNDLFIFNTIENNILYQMICDKDSNWTCVEMDLNHPTKVSDFENDAGYVKNTDYATQGDIKTKTNNTRFLASKYIDLIAKEGLANSKLKWTDEEKASARDTIGIVDETFIATYGTTTYEELKEAQDNGRAIFLKMPKIAVSSVIDDNMAIANLVRLENDNKDGITRYIFMFSCDENGVVHYASINWDTKTWNQWDYGYAKAINALQTQMSTDNSNIRTLLSTLLSTAFNSFRGGFRNTAGTLDIKCPGIYLVIGGGTGNKTMTITQNSSTVYEETCNGWFVISSDTGIITPVGIKTSLTLAGAFETPGTYQGWTKDGTHSTKISYPAESVIWYLGNANNDVGTW